MSIESFFSLLGGLALFLYGMQMMSTNLEAAAGSRMKQILERLTANRFLGVLVGAGITAIIQSSSATTVMVVGFVNSQIMTLKQAVWIIMGANIGTTITGQLIALDIGAIAPLIAFVGVALILFVKKKKVQFAGGIVAGLGILFLGMGMMSAAMIPLRNSEGFVRPSSSPHPRPSESCRPWLSAGLLESTALYLFCLVRISAPVSRPCWPPSVQTGMQNAPPSST